MTPLVLNGFEVDPRLVALMSREDWAFSRGRRGLLGAPLLPNSEAWLKPFKSCEAIGINAGGVQGICFFGIGSAISQNANLRNPELGILMGKNSKKFPPGNFDPNQGYIIGLTCDVDEGIFVDLRPAEGPIVTYSNHSLNEAHIVTAFNSVDEFVRFYIEQHGI